jgi:probable rRNA maturation factor
LTRRAKIGVITRGDPRLRLTVQVAARASGLPGPRLLRRWARAALLQDANVTLRIVGTGEGRRLNREYRGKDYATNVLTFPYPELRPLSGDIILCAGVVRREAKQQGIGLDAHFAHLVVHGMLHLQGYDHQRQREAIRMERMESEIVARLGYPDPYSV